MNLTYHFSVIWNWNVQGRKKKNYVLRSLDCQRSGPQETGGPFKNCGLVAKSPARPAKEVWPVALLWQLAERGKVVELTNHRQSNRAPDARRFPPEAPAPAPPSIYAPRSPLRLRPRRRPAHAALPPPLLHGRCSRACRAPHLRRGLRTLARRLRTDHPTPASGGRTQQVLLFPTGPRVSPRPGCLHPGT